MKVTLLTLVMIVSAAVPAICDDGDRPKPVKIETDHGGNPSDISTDELVMIFSDGAKKNLTNNGCMERAAAISHDDSLVAFIRRVDSNEDYKVNWDDEVELWIMRLDNRSETRLVKNLLDPTSATWHPKQRELAFIATDSEGDRKLYSYDIPKKSLKEVTTSANSWATWSPCGGMIAFYDEDNRIVVHGCDDKAEKVLTGDVGNGWALYWTTDGRLVFTEEKIGWQIYTPGEKAPKPLPKKEHKKLTFVDQERFGWATNKAEQGGAGQPATRSESKSEGGDKPQPESEGRSR